MCGTITRRSSITLKDDDLAELDRHFRPPAKKKPLEMT